MAGKPGKVKKRKPDLKTSEGRRKYQKRYYEAHKEDAKEYQRLYNLAHKKSTSRRKGQKAFLKLQRPAIRDTYTPSDIMHMTAEKTLKALDQIINYERWFTM